MNAELVRPNVTGMTAGIRVSVRRWAVRQLGFKEVTFKAGNQAGE